jgi:hypothetical protein
MASIKSFDWKKHKSELDRLFFKSFPLVPRSVSGALNLWSFSYSCRDHTCSNTIDSILPRCTCHVYTTSWCLSRDYEPLPFPFMFIYKFIIIFDCKLCWSIFDLQGEPRALWFLDVFRSLSTISSQKEIFRRWLGSTDSFNVHYCSDKVHNVTLIYLIMQVKVLKVAEINLRLPNLICRGSTIGPIVSGSRWSHQTSPTNWGSFRTAERMKGEGNPPWLWTISLNLELFWDILSILCKNERWGG